MACWLDLIAWSSGLSTSQIYHNNNNDSTSNSNNSNKKSNNNNSSKTQVHTREK